jgi:hypothetical protein
VNGLVPDPLRFASDALQCRGGLVEPQPPGVLALLPEELAASLAVPVEARLGVGGGPDAVDVSLGSPLLDRLVSHAREARPVAVVRSVVAAPRPSHAESAAHRLSWRNAPASIQQVTPGSAWYACLWLHFTAQADERHEGLLSLVVNLHDGGEPAPGLHEGWLSESQPAVMDQAVPAAFPTWVQPRVQDLLASRLALVQAATERRHQRDHARMEEYFAALVVEARAPRRKTDPKAVEARVSHLLAERDAKLRDLATRFGLRASWGLAAGVLVEVPVARVWLELRRRKESRQVRVTLPAGAHAVDGLACAACGRPTSAPLVCDDALHVLCETCVPEAGGRPDCRACRRPGRGREG